MKIRLRLIIKSTGHHVRYRGDTYFKNVELVCRWYTYRKHKVEDDSLSGMSTF